MKSQNTPVSLKREFLSILATWLLVSLVLATLFVKITTLADANPPLLTPWPLITALVVVLLVIKPFFQTLYNKWRNREILLQLQHKLHQHYGGNVPKVTYLGENVALDQTIEQALEAKRQYYQTHAGPGYAGRDILTTLELTTSIRRTL